MFFRGKSEEDKEYLKFYFIQWVMFFSSITKGTAIGYVTYKLQLSAIELAIFAAMSTLGALGTYIISPILRKNTRNVETFFASTQIINIFFTLIAFSYSIFCYLTNTWGNFYFWLVINFFLCLSLYLEPTARSIYVKRRFPNFNFADITRSDVMTMGFAKIMGFGAGVFIVSSFAVVSVYFLNLLTLVYFLVYLLKKVKIRPFRKLKEDVVKSVEVVNLDYKTTIMLLVLNASFFTALNTQTVTYNLLWAVPFYLFAVCGSIGNIIFSFLLNKNVDLSLKNGFNKYIFLTILGYSLLYLLDGYWTLIGFAVLGGVGSSLHLFSNARLYSSKQGQDTKTVSMYYLTYNVAFALASLLFGLLLEYVGVKNVFLIYMVVPATLMYLIKKRGK